MKKLFFLFLIISSFARAQTVQTIYPASTIADMKTYYGKSSRVHVFATNEDYIRCTVCTADEITIFAGAGGRKWKKFADLIGGDTTIFETVLDSTGQPGQRILWSAGNKIKSHQYFLYDSANRKVVINHNNVSIGGAGVKLWVQGSSTVNGSLVVASYATAFGFIKPGGTASQFLKANGTVDANDYLTTALAASTYATIANLALKNNISDTAAMLSPYLRSNVAGATYQPLLISGTNIKTVNGTAVLGSGDLVVGGIPAGSTTEIQYNNAGAFGASSTFKYISTAALTSAKNYSALYINPVTTAVASTDTLIALELHNTFNKGAYINVADHLMKLNLGFLNADSNWNFSYGNGGAARPTAGSTIFIGYRAGQTSTSASFSNFFGSNAGFAATSATASNFLGNTAGSAATGANNSNFLGTQSGETATGANNSNFLGQQAGMTATSASNSNFMGFTAGKNATNASTSNFFGYQAGLGATNASSSTFIGADVGKGATGAAYSVFIGYVAGSNATHAITGANNILIGKGITTPTAGTTNTFNIGNVLYGNNTATGTTPQAAAQTTGTVGINVTTPNSTLQALGSFSAGYVAKSATYTATISDYTIECTANTFTVTVPTSVGITGREYWITNTGSGTITLATTSSQTFVNVTGTPTTLTIAQFTGYKITSNGANWLAYKIVN